MVFVHGSLDRGESFRRVMRRLPELTTLAYDRRGYQGSRGGGVVDLGGHIEDLLANWGRGEAGRAAGPVVAVGHSLGGDVVVGAALAEPGAFDAIGAFEPPMPWLGFRRDRPGEARAWPAMADDPGEEVERFFSRMVGAAAWARLTEQGRAERRADGPALVADLRSLRGEGPPFDVTALDVPSVFGMGGPTTQPHHRASVRVAGRARPRRGRLRDRGRPARRAPVAPRSLRGDDPPRGRAGGAAGRRLRRTRRAARRPGPRRTGA